jgi:hypothetical protein
MEKITRIAQHNIALSISAALLPNEFLMVLAANSFFSESIQAVTLTKSATKLGMEHLKMASFPSITLSLRISIP